MSKRYKVVGPHKVMGHKPGDEFTADLPDEKELQLLRGGHLELVPAQVKPASRSRRTSHRRRAAGKTTPEKPAE